MSDVGVAILGLAAIVVLLLLRVPVGVALSVVSLAGIYQIVGAGTMWGILSTVPYDFAAHWSLSSIPMFLLMGYICYHGNLTEGLFRLARAWLSWMPGGLAVASVGAAAGFSAVTGSSLACAAAMGRIAVPEMLKNGYDKGLATGTVAAAGTIGSLIPPSILLLIYGIFAEVPISALFIAGVIPGLLTALNYSVMIVARVMVTPSMAPRVVDEDVRRERLRAVKDTWPVIALVVGVFGGMFAGVFSPVEAGAVGAGLACVVALIRRSLSWESFKRAVAETVTSTAAIFIIAIGANLLTRFLALAGFTDWMSEWALEGEVDQVAILLGMTAIYVFLGMFLDPIGIMLLTLPIFLPIVEGAEIDLILFGILMTKYLEIGLITPPVGLNVFVIKGIVGDLMRTETIFKGILWFVAADAVTVALLIAFPGLTLFLPGLLD